MEVADFKWPKADSLKVSFACASTDNVHDFTLTPQGLRVEAIKGACKTPVCVNGVMLCPPWVNQRTPVMPIDLPPALLETVPAAKAVAGGGKISVESHTPGQMAVVRVSGTTCLTFEIQAAGKKP
jgi:hypothetical protein